jgi:transketolase
MSFQLTQDAQTFDCRTAFAEELIAMAREDDRIVAVCNDSVGSSNLVGFREEFPDRLINVGIAEQDLVGVSAGLANGGLIPFVSAAAPFLTGRALEQIKADAAYSNVHVVLCGQSPGMAYGELGPTHHSIEDLSWTRAIANLPVVVPADPVQTRAAVRWAAAMSGPAYLRIPRFKVPNVTPDDAVFEPGRSIQLSDGNDITVIATGTMVSRALEAAERLRARDIGVRVINMAFIDPLDADAVLAAARETSAIVTAEEATVSGGLGAAVASLVVEHQPVPMRILGVRGEFAPTGSAEFLLDHFGLTADGIIDAVGDVLGRVAA